MLSANELIIATPRQRGIRILEEAVGANRIADELGDSREIARVINTFIEGYFKLKILQDANNPNGTILDPRNFQLEIETLVDEFRPKAEAELRNSIPSSAELINASRNIYEMAGASALAFANKASRNLSTTMGALWERIADISPYAINPESEFDLKVKGIDLIARNFDTGTIEYQQLKTQKNTLTGSQKGRSVSELMIHANPVFCACFATNSNWTFHHPDIPRVSGGEFWTRIGISYEIVLVQVKKLVLDLDRVYVELLSDLSEVTDAQSQN